MSDTAADSAVRRQRLHEVLLGYLEGPQVILWPGADGLTTGEALLGYAEAAAAVLDERINLAAVADQRQPVRGGVGVEPAAGFGHEVGQRHHLPRELLGAGRGAGEQERAQAKGAGQTEAQAARGGVHGSS